MYKVIFSVCLFALLCVQNLSADVEEGVKANKLGFKPGQSRIDMREIYDRYWDLVEVYEGIIEDFKIKEIQIPQYDVNDRLKGYRTGHETLLTVQNLKTGKSYQYQEVALFKGLDTGFPVKVYVYTRNNGYLYILVELNGRFWELFAEDPNYDGP